MKEEIKKKEFDNTETEKGLIKTIVIIIIAILIISYFDIDMKKLMESETTKNNFSFVGKLLGTIWDSIKPIIDSIWEAVGPSLKEGVKEGIKSQL